MVWLFENSFSSYVINKITAFSHETIILYHIILYFIIEHVFGHVAGPWNLYAHVGIDKHFFSKEFAKQFCVLATSWSIALKNTG